MRKFNILVKKRIIQKTKIQIILKLRQYRNSTKKYGIALNIVFHIKKTSINFFD